MAQYFHYQKNISIKQISLRLIMLVVVAVLAMALSSLDRNYTNATILENGSKHMLEG